MTSQGPTLHENFARAHEVKRGSDRGFGLVFAVVFGVIALIPLAGGDDVRVWALAVAAVLVVVSFLKPEALASLNRLWTGFGLLLNRLVSPVALAIMFYGVVTPTGLVMRLFGKDPLRLRPEPGAASYWVERRPPGPAPDSIRNQF